MIFMKVAALNDRSMLTQVLVAASFMIIAKMRGVL